MYLRQQGEAYAETYRGIVIAITCKGVWLFRDWPHCAGAADRYFTAEERSNPDKQAMRNAIDRMISRSPVYTGDLRDLPVVTKPKGC